MYGFIAKTIIWIQNTILGIITRILFSQESECRDPASILIFRTSALGDFLFAVPSMVKLRKRYPKSRIVLLTTTSTHSDTKIAVQRYAGTSNTLPWLTFVIPSIIDEAIYFHSLDLKNILTEIRPQIDFLDPDMTFILSHPGDSGVGLLKKILLLKVLGVRRNIFGWRMRSSLYFLRAAQFNAGLIEHKIFGPLRAISECTTIPCCERSDIEFPLYIDPIAEQWAQSMWHEKGWQDVKVVAVAPGSIQPHKRWPLENFLSLMKILEKSYAIAVVIVGTKGDHALGERFSESIAADVVNLAGEISISHSAALLKRCALLVGNDGGAMHLGAAMGCPSVSIVPGIEYPGSVEPWGNSDLAVRHDVPCTPCYSFTYCPEKHNHCMTDLPVSAVLEKCMSILNHV